MTRSLPLRIALGLVGLLASAALAAFVTDLVMTDTTFRLDDPTEAQTVPVLDIDASGVPVETDDPGAMVAPVLVPSTPPLLPDPPRTPPVIDDDPNAPGAAVTTEPAPTDVSSPSWNGLAMQMMQPFEVTAAGFDTVFRFFDLCADASQVTACPDGFGATVLFAGGSAPPPPVDLVLIPDPPQPIRDQVRCDLAWPSSTTIPLLIVSNQPLDLYHARLSLTDGREVDEAVNQRATPSEVTWYEGRIQGGSQVGLAVGDGVHACVEFRLDGPQAPSGIDRTDRFHVRVTGFAGQSSATRATTFDGTYSANKPPVTIHPVDGYRAVVVVPQRSCMTGSPSTALARDRVSHPPEWWSVAR